MPEAAEWGRRMVMVGAVLAALGVAAGAFGAHALAERLSEARLETWRTAASYQLVHAVALVAVGALAPQLGRSANVGAWLLVAGVLIFSGSLYLLCLSGVRWLGAITPLGGLAFIGGWLLLAWSAR